MKIELFNHGFVRLDNAAADDLSVVNSARVSFAKRSEEMTDADVGLVSYLMRHKHGTPFEHNMFRFHVKAPIFVNREWFRHRIGSFNEESSRYSEMKPHFYVPALDDVRTQVGKPGAYRFESASPEVAILTKGMITNNNYDCYSRYRFLLGQGVAREVARDCLPVTTYSEFYWTLNARSLMHFLCLRNAPQALLEIRRYAEAVESIFAATMPVTHQAWVDSSRVAP